ncbi:MAG: NAD-dependent epimerase/dehydratase family protein [Bacteroidota bacterium]
MKILIIGSKGFIGSHCVSFFSKEHEVWECDVVSDYVTPRYFLIDATNANYNEVMSSEPFDICINCAGAASVPDSIKNPLRDFELNVAQVFKQLDAIRQYNPGCKYINFSSAAVYGNPTYLPIDENHPLNPISPYGNHKKMAEEICTEFYENFGIQTFSLRVFSAYGPGLQKQLFWDLYKKSQANAPIELWGTGEESRDFIHITDLVDAVDKVMKHGDFNGEAINIALGKEVVIKDVVSIFYSELAQDTSFTFIGKTRKGDPINWCADISKLQSLGFSPVVTTEKGITSYINWLDTLMS